ncbi:hypothetical protein CAOG_03535 [Capsaspora owczarzaki ATCC 30864]|uniref:Uncharacterized protein n=1 Tax=Capsaspora owczarzaki (strain ATCC 30864) TaxID=595528 RepID=A0A0D2UCA3_CAPO3|nr:hypothetical protein CAOG_03535 [Capsaspora owczarzaki ATCC 30864]KJE92611.1 hypothetical protein CAOG_003535 [Capsaspora owczarzaki ATCC 30864]|eukprot:XP_004348440.1 hypothetical protein CAOG_03535 [Capsaspora owczarzaki ATCC 30864]
MVEVRIIRSVGSVISKLIQVTRGSVSEDATADLNQALAHLRDFEIEVSNEIPDPTSSRLFQDYVAQELLKVLRHKTQFGCFVFPKPHQTSRDLAAFFLERFQQKRIAADMQG